MSIANEIQLIVENRLAEISDVNIEKGEQYEGVVNRTTVYMTTDYLETLEDESGDSGSDYTFMSYEIRVEGVSEVGAKSYEPIYLLSDEFKISLKTISRRKILDYTGTHGRLVTFLEDVLIDQIAKPIKLDDSIGFVVFGKVRLFQTII